MMKKKFKKALGIFQALLTIILVLAVLLLVFTAFNPMKNYRFLRVMSGSMEPTIKTGAVVLIQKVAPESLRENDIITFGSAEDPNLSITHRLVKIEEKEGETVFKTRGDANNSEDINEVSPADVQGKVIFSIPLLGYLAVFIKEPLGFGLLVVLPAILIIISEILNIKKAIEEEVEKKYAKENLKKSPDEKITGLLIFLLFLGGIFLAQSKPTNAYFSDTVVVEGNIFSMASDWTTPIISNINYLIATPGETNELKAIIFWGTNEDADSFVDYGLTHSYGQSVGQADFTNAHAVEITKLEENKTYHFRVKSKDAEGNEIVSEDRTFETSHAHYDFGDTDIVINEFLPNPVGDDNALAPNGEWVELYNRSDKTLSVEGWSLTDAKEQRIIITPEKTNLKTTSIAPHGFLVVYLNGQYSDWLGNNIDNISLWKPAKWHHWQWWLKVDDYLYGVFGEEIIENKSFARIPDGGNTWYDPIPTPGGPNRLEETLAWSDLPAIEPPKPLPELDFYLEKEKAAVGFRAVNISQYKSLDYQVLYQTDGIEKGIDGQITLQGENEVGKSGLLLGTCSQDVCVYDQKITKIDLNVKLREENGKETSLSKSLNLENQR